MIIFVYKMNTLKSILITKKSNKKEDDIMEIESTKHEKEPNSNLNLNSKKIKKIKREDYKDFKLIEIGFPEKMTVPKRCKKRYGVKVKSMDKEGKIRKKLVRFRREGKDEFIDHKYEMKKIKPNDENFLHPNF